jgi:hypothetical protein
LNGVEMPPHIERRDTRELDIHSFSLSKGTELSSGNYRTAWTIKKTYLEGQVPQMERGQPTASRDVTSQYNSGRNFVSVAFTHFTRARSVSQSASTAAHIRSPSRHIQLEIGGQLAGNFIYLLLYR